MFVTNLTFITRALHISKCLKGQVLTMLPACLDYADLSGLCRPVWTMPASQDYASLSGLCQPVRTIPRLSGLCRPVRTMLTCLDYADLVYRVGLAVLCRPGCPMLVWLSYINLSVPCRPIWNMPV